MIGLLELFAVIGILFLDLLMYLDQRKTNKFQRAYWQERTDWMARRLQNPPGKTKPQSTQKNKTPATVVTALGAFENKEKDVEETKNQAEMSAPETETLQ